MWPFWRPKLLPPWLKYPDLEMGGLGWRMGYGEGYLDEFFAFFRRLSPRQKRDYIRRYPPPAEWAGFWED